MAVTMHIAQANGGWTGPAAELVRRKVATPKGKITSSSSLSFSLLSSP
jgi:hypothetical protein